MIPIIEIISTKPALFWLFLGGLLLIGELLGTAGYLLWSGIAGIITALFAWLFPALNWQIYGLLFAIMTIASALIWRRWLDKRSAGQPDLLNEKIHQLLHVRTHLLSDTDGGYSRVKIADGSWRAYSELPLSAGTEVEVTAIKGITLIVKTVSPVVNNTTRNG